MTPFEQVRADIVAAQEAFHAWGCLVTYVLEPRALRYGLLLQGDMRSGRWWFVLRPVN